jgi:hypothetical protein
MLPQIHPGTADDSYGFLRLPQAVLTAEQTAKQGYVNAVSPYHEVQLVNAIKLPRPGARQKGHSIL